MQQQEIIDYPQEVFDSIVATLDDEATWKLAHVYLSRGFVRPIQLSGTTHLGVHFGEKLLAARGIKFEDAEASLGDSIFGRARQPAAQAAREQQQVGSACPPACGPQAAAPTANTRPRERISLADTIAPTVTSQRHAAPSAPRPNDGQVMGKRTVDVTSKSHTDTQAKGPPAVGKVADDAVATNTVQEDESNASTLILRNLPGGFDQNRVREWIDDKGYKNKYDFLLWFPAKQTSRMNSRGYAFVNFLKPEYAVDFRTKLHLTKIPDPERPDDDASPAPVSIAVAKVQGFVNNYQRYQHLLDGVAPTRCAPYFAKESLDNLTPEEVEVAKKHASASTVVNNGQQPAGDLTTIIIRNLPPALESQEVARQWLDDMSYKDLYNFFLYLPPKRPRRGRSSKNEGEPIQEGYCFVNFAKSEDATRCIEGLDGQSICEGDPELSVVGAKVQGKDACLDHFRSLAESGRCKPWVQIDALQTYQ